VILISGSENNLQPGRTADDVAREEAGLLFSSSLPGYLVEKPLPLYERDAWFAWLPARLPPRLRPRRGEAVRDRQRGPGRVRGTGAAPRAGAGQGLTR